MYGKNILLFGKEKKETFIGCAEKREIRQENRKLVMDVASKGEVSWGESFCAHPTHLMQKTLRVATETFVK